MTKYKNENAFKHSLKKHLEKQGYRVSIIETGLTCVGVPDLFVETPKYDYWIELKRVHSLFQRNSSFSYRIPWRPGQQAWMVRRYRITKRPAFTFVAFDNCVISILMDRVYKDNVIRGLDVLTTWDRVSLIQL